jgi:hypothetical protein
MADQPADETPEKAGLDDIVPGLIWGFVKAVCVGLCCLAFLAMFPPILVLMFLPIFREITIVGFFVVLLVLIRTQVWQWMGALSVVALLLTGIAIQKTSKHLAASALATGRDIANPFGKIPVLFMMDGPWAVKYGGEILARGQATKVALLKRHPIRTSTGALAGYQWDRRDYELVDSGSCDVKYHPNYHFASTKQDYANNTLNSFGRFKVCVAETRQWPRKWDYRDLLERGVLFRTEDDDELFPDQRFNNPKIGEYDGSIALEIDQDRNQTEFAKWEFARSLTPDRNYGTRLSLYEFFKAVTGMDEETSGMLVQRTPKEACAYLALIVPNTKVRPDGAYIYLDRMSTEPYEALNVYKKTYTGRRLVENLIDIGTIQACERMRDAICSQRFVNTEKAKKRCNELFDGNLANWRKLTGQE